jgi:two-component system, NarL family, sensor histidine kinase DevS
VADTGKATDEATIRLEPLADLSPARIWGMLESAPDAMLMTDECGVMLGVNRQAEVVFGYDRGDLLGRSVDMLLPQRFHDAHRAHRAQYGAAPTIRAMGIGLELRARRSDGSEFPVEVSLSPLDDADGSGVVVSIRDISDRVEVERQLATSEAMFRTAFEHAPVGMMLTRIDLEGRRIIERANTSLGSMLDRSPESLCGVDISEITHPDDEVTNVRAAAQLAEGSRDVYTTEKRYRRSDGSYVWTLLHASVIDRAGGTLTLGHVVDISDRRQRQAERARLARMDDRDRIARDLHDLVIQRLFAAGMKLQSVIPQMASDVAVERTHETIDELDATIRELRSAIFDLHANDSAHSVSAGIIDEVETITAVLGFRPEIEFGDIDDLPTDVTEELLSTLREALSNVGRHAHASMAHIGISQADEVVTLVVRDDGVGIPDAFEPGNGLRNMVQRAARLGGECKLVRVDTGGTKLTWRVPC